MEQLQTKESKKKQRVNSRNSRRKNAKLYPIYKMFSWDLLCYYSIEFLFYTMTKGITASQLLIVDAFYILFEIICQIPAVAICDLFGRKKSLIIGNVLLVVHMLMLIFIPGMIGVIISNFICALGYSIKCISESNLLYDSVATRGGEGLYSKIEARGGSWYYYLDGILCLSAGYLFVINNYLPMIICLICLIISTILSFRFIEIQKTTDSVSKNGFKKVLKEYSSDLKKSVKFIFKSNRMKAYILFGAVFYGTITIIDLYNSNLLVEKGVSEEQYSIIFAVLTLIAGIAVTFTKKIHKKFRNRTLTFISMLYIGACLVIGISANVLNNNLSIPIILIMFAILRITSSVWYIIKEKYLKNFTTEEMRNRISFTYELTVSVIASIMSVIGSFILNIFDVENAFLLMALALFIIIVLTLDYMRNRFGLKPKQYSKEDIEL